LNQVRRKELHGPGESMGTAGGRTESERDYDRILFATPTRRLADKTQVFPMEENDSVRTRLTHSFEVSNLARSIGVRLAFEHAEEVFGPDHELLQVKRNVPSLLAAIGLAHDLGNPPFGHQGELAIQQWFFWKGMLARKSTRISLGLTAMHRRSDC
jgi:dGTPase